MALFVLNLPKIICFDEVNIKILTNFASKIAGFMSCNFTHFVTKWLLMLPLNSCFSTIRNTGFTISGWNLH